VSIAFVASELETDDGALIVLWLSEVSLAVRGCTYHFRMRSAQCWRASFSETIFLLHLNIHSGVPSMWHWCSRWQEALCFYVFSSAIQPSMWCLSVCPLTPISHDVISLYSVEGFQLNKRWQWEWVLLKRF